MTLVVASSTAWTRSSRQSGSALQAVATSRTALRISATRSTSARIRRWRCGSGTGGGRSGEPGVVGGRALHESAVALLPGERPVPDDDAAARQDDVARALDLAALVARVVHRHVVGLGGDRPGAGRVVDDQIGVG